MLTQPCFGGRKQGLDHIGVVDRIQAAEQPDIGGIRPDGGVIDDLIVKTVSAAPQFDFRALLMQIEGATIRTNFKRLMELAELKQSKIALNFNADDRTVQMPQEIY